MVPKTVFLCFTFSFSSLSLHHQGISENHWSRGKEEQLQKVGDSFSTSTHGHILLPTLRASRSHREWCVVLQPLEHSPYSLTVRES